MKIQIEVMASPSLTHSWNLYRLRVSVQAPSSCTKLPRQRRLVQLGKPFDNLYVFGYMEKNIFWKKKKFKKTMETNRFGGNTL